MKILSKIVMALIVVICSVSAEGQVSKFKALYLFQFAKGTNWSEADSGKPFVITVVGDKGVASDLKSVVGSRTVAGRSIVVNDEPSIGSLPKSDIIYLGESKTSSLGQLLTSQSGNVVLIVAGGKGQCSQGAGISFLPVGGKLNYDISEANIARYGLKVSPKVLQLGHQVY